MVSLTSIKKIKKEPGWLKPFGTVKVSCHTGLDSLDGLNGFLDTYCLIACLLGRQRCPQTPCLSLSRFFFFPFLSNVAGLCCECRGWGSFWFVVFFRTVFWGLFDVDPSLSCVLMVCGADLFVWRGEAGQRGGTGRGRLLTGPAPGL